MFQFFQHRVSRFKIMRTSRKKKNYIRKTSNFSLFFGFAFCGFAFLFVFFRNVTDQGSSPYYLITTNIGGVAVNNFEDLSILPYLEAIIRGGSQAQDNKSYTSNWGPDSLCILSII